ncbi:MAG: branched-chain amino acid ABC transporter substrate-binding protein [Chloroflexi bacterium]|nr:branched-chain amino acid ABC transporter substrate-binding protein [Chloroflexota bacterium]
MSKRIFALLSLLIVFSMVLAACATPAAPEEPAAPAEPQATEAPAEPAATEAPAEPAPMEKGTIKIATQTPLSGSQSVLGVDIKRGAELAMSQLSGPLTEMGFKVELAPFDDQANPDTGVANAKQIVADPEIICGVGHLNSGVMIPSSEEYHTAGLAFVSPANTNPKVTDRGYGEVNRIVGRDDLQGPLGAQFAFDSGAKSVYIVHDKTSYGQGVAEFFKGKAEELGLTVVGFEGSEERANFDALITPIIAATPDLVYFGGIYDQAGVFFKQAREKGFEGIFLGPDGMDSSDLTKIAGDGLLSGGGMFYTTVSGPAKLYPNTAKFTEDFKAAYNADPQPFAAQGYDAMGLCLKAIEDAAKAKNGELPTRADVAAAIRALKDFPGITGTFTFNEIGDLTVAKYFIMKVVSSDPAKWNDNEASAIIELEPPKK